MDLEKFCKDLPKIELHAHLNGSLSEDTLLKLGCLNESIQEYSSLNNILYKTERTLNDCFKLFKVAHDVTSNINHLYIATGDVIEEFYNDGVLYLELRTTPRCGNGMNKKQYIECVVKAIKDQNNIIVKLILSIDRRHDKEESEKTLDLITEMKTKYPNIIVGIDLCGNPNIGEFDGKFFAKAKENGLKITLHCGEIVNHEETFRMLEFRPDRLGHATCIHPNSKGSLDLWQCYLKEKIPIEACMTSNIMCGTTPDYKAHHVKYWYKNSLPFSLGTDDKGVFSTSLSKEYYQFAKTFDCNKEQLLKISRNVIQQTFSSEEEKNKLKETFDRFMRKETVL